MQQAISRRAALTVALSVGLVATGAGEAQAAAPRLSRPRVTTVATTARTAFTYTGYMNGESFQQDGITTFAGHQYAAWWDSAGYVNLSRRPVGATAWSALRFTDYRTSSTDSHGAISIGISGEDGTIHLAFDTHSSQFRYRRSQAGLATDPGGAAWSTEGFTDVVTSLTEEPMAQVTYPQFLRTPSGVLQLAIRTGRSGAGDEVLYEYRPTSWTSIGRFIDGTTAGNNAYLFGIEYDDSELLHMSWTVRETPDPSTNHDLYYASSDDRGRTWRNSAGAVVGSAGSRPLVADSAALRVVAIGKNRGLMNQESQVVDAAGDVHVLASHLPASARSQSDFTKARRSAVLVHHWRERSTGRWRNEVLRAKGVLSRGDIGVTARGDLVVVCGSSSTRHLSVLTASKTSGWSDWATRYTSSTKYSSDALLDHQRLRGSGVVSVVSPRSGGRRIDVLEWTVA